MPLDTPVTERSNPITQNIDSKNSYGIVECLHQSDCQLFEGWEDYLRITDKAFIKRMMNVSNKLKSLMKLRDQKVNAKMIIGGCGTSGRMAFLLCRNFNEHLVSIGKSPLFTYVIAGGDKALFTSQEAPEDDPNLGAADLAQASVDCEVVIYIGVTCGLSAPYIAGQLDYCRKNPDRFTAILVGFNPTHLARDTPIRSWTKSFKALVEELEQNTEATILNPVLGPEPITGSSRMKGGSATKILLEMVYLMSQSYEDNEGKIEQGYRELFDSYKQSCDHLYTENHETLAQLVDRAGQCLLTGGRIVYIGSGVSGVLAMIDASECVPTYGSDINDIRGYLESGYDSLHNKEGNIGHLGDAFQISWQNFKANKLMTLTAEDLVICLDTPDHNIKEDNSVWLRCKADVVTIAIDTKRTSPSTVSTKFIRQLCVKWICNCMSTGAHILKGKVFGNIMIDVRISNRKLYHRAIRIMETICRCTYGEAETVLQTAVFNTAADVLLTEDDVIRTATTIRLVLPTAVLMLLAKCSRDQAQHLLQQEPIVRKAVLQYYTSAGS